MISSHINQRNKIILFFVITLLLIQWFAFNVVSPIFSLSTISTTLFISIIVFILYVLKGESNLMLKGQYFRISNLFLVGFIIVHFQFYIDLVLGNFGTERMDFIIDLSIVNQSIILVSSALTAFFIGYLLNNREIIPKKNYTSKLDYLLGLELLVYLLFVVFFVTAEKNYFLGGYSSVKLSTIAIYSQDYLILAIVGAIILKLRNLLILRKEGLLKNVSFIKYVRKQGVLFSLFLLLYCLLVISSGDRGPVLQIFLVYFGSFVILTHKRYKLIGIILVVFLASVVVSFLAYFRHFEGTGSFIEKIQMSQEMDRGMVSNKMSVSPSTFELATSIRTVHAAVSYSQDDGYWYGLFQSYQIVGIVPGLGLLFQNLTGLSPEELRSAHFLTAQIQGNEVTHGLGTSCVADIYLDFGYVGVILSFIIFGYFLRNLDVISYSNLLYSKMTYIVLAIFLSKSIYIGRSTIVMLFREVVLCYIIITIGLIIGYGLKKSSK